MGELARIGIAIPQELLEEFDGLIERRGYATWSWFKSDAHSLTPWRYRSASRTPRLRVVSYREGICRDGVSHQGFWA